MRRKAWLGIGLAALALGAAVGCGSSNNDLVSGSGGTGGAAGGSGGTSSVSCKTSLDCPADEVCDPSSSTCVQCVGNDDCRTGELCGGDNLCHRACVTDKQCKPLGQLCDKAHGWCTPTGSGGAGGADGGTAGSGGSSGSGGTGGAGAGGSDAGCTKPPLDLVVLLDRSASMQDLNKWNNVTQGLGALNAQGVSGVGLGFFPVAPTGAPPPTSCTKDADCGAYGPCMPTFNICSGSYSADVSCIPSDYASPAVPISAVPGVISKIATAVQTTTPDGSATPMAPALQGTYDYTTSFLKAHPGHLGAVLLITDGDPTSCTGNDINGVAAAAATAFTGSPSIKTYVVGIGTTANLDLVAQAAGTGTAYVVSAANPIQAVADAVDAAVKDVPCK